MSSDYQPVVAGIGSFVCALINREIEDLHCSSERLQQAIREANELPAGTVKRPVILAAAKA